MNKVTLMGRLTKDVDIKYTQTTNTMVGSFTLAVRRRGKDEPADFINCKAFGKSADLLSTYCKKGNQVAIVGRIQTRNWTDEQDKKHYITEVIVEEVHFAEGKKKEESPEPDLNINEIPLADDDLPF